MPKKGAYMPRMRSAYQGGKYKNTAASKITAAVRRRKVAKRVGLNKVEKKQVKKIIASRKEHKYCPSWIRYDYYDPNNYTANNLPPVVASIALPNVWNSTGISTTTIVGFQTGESLNSASDQLDAALTAAGQGPCMNPLGGFAMQQGDSQTNIDGQYAYFQSGCVTFHVNALIASGNVGGIQPTISPLCFRLLHVKARKDPAGTTPSLSGQLFRDYVNANAGLMSEMTRNDVMTNFSLNRERFQIEHDIKFKLSQPIDPTYAANNPNPGVQMRNLSYPSEKMVKVWLDKPKKKLRFQESAPYEPTNYDYVHYFIILCSREQVPSNQSNYPNTGKCWSITAQGQTKFRDC